jgi:hypothetical protein
MTPRRVLVAVIIILALCGTALVAQTILERLVSPGPLSRPHAKIERNCVSCHTPFAPKTERANCLSCHKPIARDIKARVGLHGRKAAIRVSQCRACHTEHRGREKKIAAFNTGKFDHALTDFPLKGKHARTTCRSCHAPGRKATAAPTQCVACHAKADVHRGRFGRNCASCHVETGWRDIRRFDHALTGYPLIGQHRTTSCASCHTGRRFAGTPRQCIACHVEDDVHKGSRGRECASCHTPVSWKAATFNHDNTRFPLTGAHNAVGCVSCHQPGMAVRKPPLTCIGCHAKDDVHKGSNGKDCASCHVTASWRRIDFDHDRLTRFPLRGAHRSITCTSCHTVPPRQAKPPTTCIGCHAKDDAHRGRLGPNCASCHTETAWKMGVQFDHTLTAFPLLGKHAALSCATCHADRSFTAAGTNCAACHADTHHRGRLGRAPDCATCHVPTSWTLWRFDHGRQTGFALDGRHRTLTCHACHARPAASANIDGGCVTCHRADDIHRGRFGKRCADCHTTAAFRPAQLPGPRGKRLRPLPPRARNTR